MTIKDIRCIIFKKIKRPKYVQILFSSNHIGESEMVFLKNRKTADGCEAKCGAKLKVKTNKGEDIQCSVKNVA